MHLIWAESAASNVFASFITFFEKQHGSGKESGLIWGDNLKQYIKESADGRSGPPGPGKENRELYEEYCGGGDGLGKF